MNSLIEITLQSTLATRKDVFGENCTFVSFEADEKNFEWSTALQSSGRFGRMVYIRNGNVEYSDHLVLKVNPTVVFNKDCSPLAFFSEIFFYTRILPFFENINPEISDLFPKYYGSLLQYNVGSDQAVIIFENLQANNYRPAKRHSFLDYDHLKLMMKKLGEFHAYSYRAREEAADQFLALTSCWLDMDQIYLKQLHPIVTVSLGRSVEPLSSDPSYGPKIKNRGIRQLFAKCDKVMMNAMRGDTNNRTHVLCHGDFLRNNVLFKYEKGKPTDLKLVDLATWRFASPVVDLAQVLYLNADQRMRNENWDRLIDEYYDAVRNTFPSTNVPSKELILAEFKTNVSIAYFIASFFLPRLMADDKYNDASPSEKNEDSFSKYRNKIFNEIPPDVMNHLLMNSGGDEATNALIDVLKDVIDRGFL